MFERNKVYDRLELEARVDILTEEYRKSVKAEVLTLLDISKKDILLLSFVKSNFIQMHRILLVQRTAIISGKSSICVIC